MMLVGLYDRGHFGHVSPGIAMQFREGNPARANADDRIDTELERDPIAGVTRVCRILEGSQPGMPG
jgi:hypothetical protein